MGKKISECNAILPSPKIITFCRINTCSSRSQPALRGEQTAGIYVKKRVPKAAAGDFCAPWHRRHPMKPTESCAGMKFGLLSASPKIPHHSNHPVAGRSNRMGYFIFLPPSRFAGMWCSAADIGWFFWILMCFGWKIRCFTCIGSRYEQFGRRHGREVHLRWGLYRAYKILLAFGSSSFPWISK